MEVYKKEVNIIVAMAENNTIGKDNKLLWHLPNDLKFFKQTTMGCPIIMGRKTYESIGRLLPGRENIIITRSNDYEVEGAIICHSLDAAIDSSSTKQVFVIGGGEIYKQAMSICHKLFVTRVHQEIEGDTFFPAINEQEWSLTWFEKQQSDEKNMLAHTFQRYERKNELNS
ncbi:MAG: dihydrofolate reductase [Flavobacteriales bacterium]|jgi:dihydrofolate reductase